MPRFSTLFFLYVERQGSSLLEGGELREKFFLRAWFGRIMSCKFGDDYARLEQDRPGIRDVLDTVPVVYAVSSILRPLQFIFD
jgi:hypothetical protein